MFINIFKYTIAIQTNFKHVWPWNYFIYERNQYDKIYFIEKGLV